MTLCNKSFSATQFALLSALSAVGRVYVGPIAGWFVEAHGWPTFYLFSVVAAVPGSYCYWSVARRWNIPANRTLYATHGISSRLPFCVTTVNGGLLCLVLWLVVLIINATTSLVLPLEALLLDAGALLAVAGILTGGLLDFMALRKTQLT